MTHNSSPIRRPKSLSANTPPPPPPPSFCPFLIAVTWDDLRLTNQANIISCWPPAGLIFLHFFFWMVCTAHRRERKNFSTSHGYVTSCIDFSNVYGDTWVGHGVLLGSNDTNVHGSMEVLLFFFMCVFFFHPRNLMSSVVTTTH